MKFSDVQVIGGPPVLATAAEVDALAARLWVTFPAGYREYVTRLGEGVLGGFVRIYPPWRIESDLADWRRRIGKYWFWGEGRELLPKDRALECVIIGDTVGGDELVFHPARPEKVFVLPHDDERVFKAGGDLLSAVDWVCSSGELIDPVEDWTFKPFDSRVERARRADEGPPADPEGESLDEIVEIAKGWAARHSARERASEELKAHVPKGAKAELLHEGIIIRSELLEWDVGYGIAWRIVEADGGREVGVFRWSLTGESYGSSFEPAKR